VIGLPSPGCSRWAGSAAAPPPPRRLHIMDAIAAAIGLGAIAIVLP
jgi:hypothetical protein